MAQSVSNSIPTRDSSMKARELILARVQKPCILYEEFIKYIFIVPFYSYHFHQLHLRSTAPDKLTDEQPFLKQIIYAPTLQNTKCIFDNVKI